MMPKEVDYEKIGQRVRKLRLEKGMTQSQLSELVDCSNNYLSHIETAQTKVSLTMLLRLSYALEAGLDYFLLDTPFVQANTVIDEEISKKLAKCAPPTLLAVNKAIDILLEQQEILTDY